MSRKRKWSDDDLIKAVAESENYNGVLRQLNLKLGGGTYAHVKMRIRQLDLNTSHFTGRGWCYGDKHADLIQRFVKIPLEKILVKDSTYLCTNTLRKRLLKEGLLRNECYICGLGPEWNGLQLTLQLDHIDGDRCNNLIGNLRLTCPNCHSQTSNFAGKNTKKNV